MVFSWYFRQDEPAYGTLCESRSLSLLDVFFS